MLSEEQLNIIQNIPCEHHEYIGHYPNAVSPETCNRIIKYFEDLSRVNKNYSRLQSEGTPTQIKKDESINAELSGAFNSQNDSILVTNVDACSLVIENELAKCFHNYKQKYYEGLHHINIWTPYHKVQKTLPSGGYHVWHTEQGGGNYIRRILVYTLYLNDVEEGGETEFLYQRKRYPARQGDICIFPAHFTHPHRGNPPISGEKYIMTGWFESIDTPDDVQLIPK